jgi:hypothetical protein
MDFSILNMNIHICHSKTMYDPFNYLTYWICTNIVHINHNMKFMWFLYELKKIEFCTKICTNPWSLVINLWYEIHAIFYEHMKIKFFKKII